MPRHGSSHLSWLEPVSADALSPMQLLVIWLSRHYTKYSNSNTKGEMIQELCQGMKDAGYPGCTVHAIRSKIHSLKGEARRTGDRRHSRAFQQYQQSLRTIFTAEDQDTTNTADEENTAANCVLDVSEIRRRFELLCARHALEEEGVAIEVIDRMLPLP